MTHIILLFNHVNIYFSLISIISFSSLTLEQDNSMKTVWVFLFILQLPVY